MSGWGDGDDGILNFWQQNGASLSVESLTNYDPYLGRITEPGTKEG